MPLRPALLLLALLTVLTAPGCLTGKLPSAAFAGMTVTTVQPDPGSQKVELEVGFHFKVRNPLGIQLAIPKHTFALTIDGAPVASTGTRNAFDVPAGSAKRVTYPFRLDLSEKGLGRAFGKDAVFAFTADAEIDVPSRIVELLGEIPGGKAVTDKVGGAAKDLLATGLQALKGSTNGMGKARLTLAHEGNLRLPRFPTVRGMEGAKPDIALVGRSETASLDNLIGQLTSRVEPLAAFLTQFENAVVNQEVDIPVGELLERIGVPASLTSAALAAINGVLQINGKQAIGNKNNAVSVPVKLPKLSVLLGALDPKAASKIDQFQAGWSDFKTNPALGSLIIPTALPQGIRVATSFEIGNPNEFSITAPSFQLGLVTANGTPVALIGVTAPSVAKTALGTNQSQLVTVAAKGASEMRLVSEFNWDAIGTNLLTAAATGAKPDLSGLTLVGEISIDPGYGPITVPFRIPLGAGTTSTGAAASTSSKPAASSSSSGATSTEKPNSGTGKPTGSAAGSGSSSGTTKTKGKPKGK